MSSCSNLLNTVWQVKLCQERTDGACIIALYNLQIKRFLNVAKDKGVFAYNAVYLVS